MFAPFEANLDLVLEHGYPPEGTATAIQRFRRVPRTSMLEMFDCIRAVIDDYMGRPENDDYVEGGGDPEAAIHGVIFLCESFVELPSHLQPNGWAPTRRS